MLEDAQHWKALLCETRDAPNKSRKSPEGSPPPLSLCTRQTRSSGEGLACSRALSEPVGCRSPCRAASHSKALHQPSLLILPRIPEPRGPFSPRPAPGKPPFLLCSSVPTASQAHLLQEPARTAAPELFHVRSSHVFNGFHFQDRALMACWQDLGDRRGDSFFWLFGSPPQMLLDQG